MTESITLGEVGRKLDAIAARVDTIDTKVDQHAVVLARLEERLAYSERQSGRIGARWGAGAGAFLGGIISAIWGLWGR